jgi:hypothetical protein
MMNRLRRILMSLDQATSDGEVDVNISPALGDMLGRFYRAHTNELYADFVIRCRKGHVFKTNRMFACILFDTIKTKVSQAAFSEAEKRFFLMDTVHIWELKELIAVMCGQKKCVKVSLMLRLLRIARRYLVPECMLNALVASSIRLVKDQAAALQQEQAELKDEFEMDQLEHFRTVKASAGEPMLYGYTDDDLSKAGAQTATIGSYYVYTEGSVGFRAAALVVSEVTDQKVFVRFYDGRTSDDVVKKVELASLSVLLNFSHVKPATIYPFTIREGGGSLVRGGIIPLIGDTSVCAAHIGHFCVRVRVLINDSNTALILGIHDAHSLFILKDGLLDTLRIDDPEDQWELIGSINAGDQVERLMQYTNLIVHACHPKARYPNLSDDVPSQLENGQFYGCVFDEPGGPMAVLLLSSDGVDSVDVCFFNTTPCIYK